MQAATQAGSRDEAGGLTARLLRQGGALSGAPAAKRKLPAGQLPGAALKGPATASIGIGKRGLRMDTVPGRAAQQHDAGDVEDESAGHAGSGRGRQDVGQASMHRLHADGLDTFTEPAAKRARLGPAALPKPAAGAAAAAQRQGSTPQPAAVLPRMLSRAAAAATSAPAADAGPAAHGRGASKEGPAMRSSSLAGRIGNGHAQQHMAEGPPENNDIEEQVGRALSAGRSSKPRANGGLFGAAMAGVESIRGRPRAAAARPRKERG